MQLCWISAAERSLAALLEETLVEKPGFPGFFYLEHRDPTEGLIRLEIR